MRQIAYFSTASRRQDAKTVHDILVTARANNLRDEISGLLVAGGNRYLQVIEGPRAPVEALYARIRADDRHLAVATLLDRSIAKRCFGDWSMAYRREPKLGEFDSFPSVVRYLTEQVDDMGLRAQIRHFAKVFITDQPATGPALWKMAS